MYHRINHTVGYNYKNQTIDFQGQDSKELFCESLQKQPPDWYYRSTPVTYSYNSLGHRTIQPEEILDGEYILSTGCSFTEGIGINDSSRFSEIVASHFNLKSYNIALSGSGIDLLSYNLLSWLSNYPKPRAVIIQWPQKERKFYHPGDNITQIHCVGPWVLDDNIAKSYGENEPLKFKSLLKTESFDHYYSILRLTILASLKMANIPTVEINCLAYTKMETLSLASEVISPAISDWARDLSHPGIIWNNTIAQEAIKQLSDKITK